MTQLCSECKEVEDILEIDLQRLFQDLAEKKRSVLNLKSPKSLTDDEKFHICLLLLGNTPRDIVEKKFNLSEGQRINKRTSNLRKTLSITINSYFKELISDLEKKIDTPKQLPSWANIIVFTIKHYKKESNLTFKQSQKITIEIPYDGNLSNKNIVRFWEMVKKNLMSLDWESIEQEEEEKDEEE
jgi:hypothetical protein